MCDLITALSSECFERNGRSLREVRCVFEKGAGVACVCVLFLSFFNKLNGLIF